MILILQEKVGDDLETEGVYRIGRWGGTGKWWDVRTPSRGDRLLWRLKPPPPVDRELAQRELWRPWSSRRQGASMVLTAVATTA